MFNKHLFFEKLNVWVFFFVFVFHFCLILVYMRRCFYLILIFPEPKTNNSFSGNVLHA
ncbi:unnamed protein product [Meloidogyne enterolobii]|uniref:Uncharacterized protein n=1 Tax=Meloidogyne enterolobii TaxID=390850 RepID=A0ACB0XM43_MELEN